MLYTFTRAQQGRFSLLPFIDALIETHRMKAVSIVPLQVGGKARA